jgi:glycosyltransferase involved in cell wall biosynthesis
MSLPRVGIICDFAEENWPSMDLVGDMLVRNLSEQYASSVRAERIRPSMARRISCLPLLKSSRLAFNADRFLGRFMHYPRWLQEVSSDFDLYHIVDHSYAHLTHYLPADRTVITCHDLDAFRCLLSPTRNRPRRTLEALARHVVAGFRRAAWMTCDTAATRDELAAHHLFPPERITVVPNGVHPSCSVQPDPGADAAATRLLGREVGETIEILHVGSTIARKRIDVLLRVFAEVRRQFPHARLVRVGGPFTPAQSHLSRQLKLAECVNVLPPLERPILAAVYRRAALVLQPSEAEGFGLPVIEAMACGTPVVASDIPALREVGGTAVVYCPVGEIESWTRSAIALLRERDRQPEKWLARRDAGIHQAEKFSWADYADAMVGIYHRLVAPRAAYKATERRLTA